MIPKSGNRFSAKIMLTKTERHRLRPASIRGGPFRLVDSFAQFLPIALTMCSAQTPENLPNLP